MTHRSRMQHECCILDASTILAFLENEDDANLVGDALSDASRCSAANWSEVAQKVMAANRDWDLVRALLHSYGIPVDPVIPTIPSRSTTRNGRLGVGPEARGCRSLIDSAQRSLNALMRPSSQQTFRGDRQAACGRCGSRSVMVEPGFQRPEQFIPR